MKRSTAFTLVEILVVIGIIVTLAALSFPAFVAAKAKAIESGCAERMHQEALAIQLYRTDHDGDGVYGSVQAMGFPLSSNVAFYNNIRNQHLVCPNGNRPIDPIFGNDYYKMFREDNEDPDPWKWSTYCAKYNDLSIILADPFHNPLDISIEMSPLLTKFGLGMTIAGNLVKVHNKGDWMFRSWWHPTKEN